MLARPANHAGTEVPRSSSEKNKKNATDGGGEAAVVEIRFPFALLFPRRGGCTSLFKILKLPEPARRLPRPCGHQGRGILGHGPEQEFTWQRVSSRARDRQFLVHSRRTNKKHRQFLGPICAGRSLIYYQRTNSRDPFCNLLLNLKLMIAFCDALGSW